MAVPGQERPFEFDTLWKNEVRMKVQQQKIESTLTMLRETLIYQSQPSSLTQLRPL